MRKEDMRKENDFERTYESQREDFDKLQQVKREYLRLAAEVNLRWFVFVVALLAIWLVCSMLSSCRSSQVLHQGVMTTAVDTSSTEVRRVIIERIDTVYAQLSYERESVMVRDTVSVLENRYARSRACILPDGMLAHDLESKKLPVAVEIPVRVEYRDSVRVEYREKPVEVVREVMPAEDKSFVGRLKRMAKDIIGCFSMLVFVVFILIGSFSLGYALGWYKRRS